MIFDNDNDEHRAQLIERLNQVNIPAYELNSGGWTMHVAATVVDTTVDPPVIEVENQELRRKILAESESKDLLLLIVSGSAASNCDIGVFYEDHEAPADEWIHVDTLDEADEEFRGRWKLRDDLAREMLRGTDLS
jgi:hypothetical protein